MAAVLLALSLAAPRAAQAGAWTLPAGQTQIITSVTASNANATYDNSGTAVPSAFQKLLGEVYAEHGVTDRITLILAPEFALAKVLSPTGKLERASGFAIKGGARYRITNSFGVLSVEASYKNAGAFDMSVSHNNDSGREIELRLLYGTNFRLFHRNGYFDIEAGERWIAGARPNETPIDLTLGFKFSPRYQLLAQSFNIIAGGDAKPPYTYYRSHKLELSVLERLWGRVYLQTGGYYAPAGQNALVERGAISSVWVYF